MNPGRASSIFDSKKNIENKPLTTNRNSDDCSGQVPSVLDILESKLFKFELFEKGQKMIK